MFDKRPRRWIAAIASVGAAAALLGSCADDDEKDHPSPEPPQADEGPSLAAYTGVQRTRVEPVAEAPEGKLPASGPIDALGVYVVGFHPMADDPSHQMIAHHYCTQKTKDFTQCVLFDGNTREANMNGIEYILSKNAFERLSPEEKRSWHPHNFEILSGQLAAPGIGAEREHALMKALMNSYGKTWHTWMSRPFESAPDPAPLGAPKLGWSFNEEGQAKRGLVELRDREMELEADTLRERRADLIPLAQPQCGVNRLHGLLEVPAQPFPGVEARAASACYPPED